jgi:hypothetical protein
VEPTPVTAVDVDINHQCTQRRALGCAFVGPIYRLPAWVPEFAILPWNVDGGEDRVDDGVLELIVLYLLTEDKCVDEKRIFVTTRLVVRLSFAWTAKDLCHHKSTAHTSRPRGSCRLAEGCGALVPPSNAPWWQPQSMVSTCKEDSDAR